MLLGTETEYAIRFTARDRQAPRPSHEVLFRVVLEAVNELVHTRPGGGFVDRVRGRAFTENGGSIYYEFVPTSQAGGLIECATPECDGPSQLLLYQRAQERLLAEAVALAGPRLARRELDGELTLLKNCRDIDGHVYGAQENYEVPIATGLGLWGWRCGVLVALPLALAASVLHWALLLCVMVLALPVVLVAFLALVLGTLGGRDAWVERWFARLEGSVEAVARVEWGLMNVAMAPSSAVVALAARWFAFRPYRREALAFLASRCVLSGAGSLNPDGRWSLSEKAGAMRRLMRWGPRAEDRGLLEIGHLMKPLATLGWGNLRGLRDLLRQRQRLQLGLSDANRCDLAEYLKIGTTALVLELVEGGALEGAPRLRRPVDAARSLSADDTLTVQVEGSDRSWTALELQRWYLERAEAWFTEAPLDLETGHLLRAWRDSLQALERDPGTLVGRLDWVTKRMLVERASGGDPLAAKKIDLRYHEIGPSGYHAWLDAAGVHVRLVDEAEVERAMREPPPRTPARRRGELVRALSQGGTDARVSWDRVVVGGPRGKVIPIRKPH